LIKVFGEVAPPRKAGFPTTLWFGMMRWGLGGVSPQRYERSNPNTLKTRLLHKRADEFAVTAFGKKRLFQLVRACGNIPDFFHRIGMSRQVRCGAFPETAEATG
jgi:hypothetical protein